MGALGDGLINLVIYKRSGILLIGKDVKSYTGVFDGVISKNGNCCITVSLTAYSKEEVSYVIVLEDIL